MLIYPIPTYLWFRLVWIQMFCMSRLAFLRFTINNIRNMHAVSTNQIADILHSSDKNFYVSLFLVTYNQPINSAQKYECGGNIRKNT